MRNVYFKVLTKKTDEEKQVSIRIRYKDGEFEQSTATGEQIQLKHWDIKKQDFKRTSFPGKDNLRLRLQKMKNHVLDEALKADHLPKRWLVELIHRYNNPDKYKHEGEQEMFSWIENWIGKSTNGYRVVRNYLSTMNDMKEFNPDAQWNDINLDYYDGFIEYLTEKGLAKNTIGGRIKNLKLFCNNGKNGQSDHSMPE